MGFEVERFLRKLPVELLCSLCKGVFNLPVHCLDCGDFFCKGCAFTHSSEFCLHPEDSLTNANKFLQEKVGNLQLACANKPHGCRHIGKVCNIEAHEAACTFKGHSCLNVECRKTGPVPLIASHTPKCEHRKVRCPQGCGSLLSMKEASKHMCIRDLKVQTAAKAARNDEIRKQIDDQKRELAELLKEQAEYEADINEETNDLLNALKEAHYAREHELSKHSQSILLCKESHEGEFGEFQDQMQENLETYFTQAAQDLQDLEVSVLSATKTSWESEHEKLMSYLIKSNANADSFSRRQSPKRFEVSKNSRNSTPKASKSFCK